MWVYVCVAGKGYFSQLVHSLDIGSDGFPATDKATTSTRTTQYSGHTERGDGGRALVGTGEALYLRNAATMMDSRKSANTHTTALLESGSKNFCSCWSVVDATVSLRAPCW